MQRSYIAIDLKSFYASVECMERGLDPMTTHLVVADPSRTEKTICLAVSPSLKAYGISGRARLFEVIEQVKRANAQRRRAAGGALRGSSYDQRELSDHPQLALSYVVATPHMAKYMELSNRIYQIYLQYIAPEDIHVYSIDEVFMDVTGYLHTYGCDAKTLAARMIHDVLSQTGITATAGIGENLYLCKVAMDILAKRMPADARGVRIAELDEMTYRRLLWTHTPITDFWRVGKGYAAKLSTYGMHTMGDVARCSLENEELLYRLFGVNAELLIDHAWGYEPCLMSDIKAYRPGKNSICAGQVLSCPYTAKKARIVVEEMTDAMSLELVKKRLVTKQLVLDIGYDIENLSIEGEEYVGKVTKDFYGRSVPQHAHGTHTFVMYTSSAEEMILGALSVFDRVVDTALSVRRITVTAMDTIREDLPGPKMAAEQISIFTDVEQEDARRSEQRAKRKRERAKQEAILSLQEQYGKNAIVKGISFEEGATTRERNGQIGGHKA